MSLAGQTPKLAGFYPERKEPSNMLTEKQAWLKIADAFDNHETNELAKSGLCKAVSKLEDREEISIDIMFRMERKINKLVGTHSDSRGRPTVYLWHDCFYTKKKERADLCRQFAKECKE